MEPHIEPQEDSWLHRIKPIVEHVGAVPLILGLVGLSLVVIAALTLIKPKQPAPLVTFSEDTPATSSATRPAALIHIDIEGAVVNPGVYSLPAGSRIKDGLEAARGLTKNADADYVARMVNQAAKLSDGAKIYIPTGGEYVTTQSEGKTTSVLGSNTSLGMININTASLSQLDTLPGIGGLTAQRIIDGRPYQRIDELVEKKIVKQSMFDKIKEKITVY